MTSNNNQHHRGERLKKEYEDLKRAWDIQREKLTLLNESLIIEANPITKFQLKHQIKTEEGKKQQIDQQLKDIELQQEQNGLEYSQNNEPQHPPEIEPDNGHTKAGFPRGSRTTPRSSLIKLCTYKKQLIIFIVLFLGFGLGPGETTSPEICKSPAADVSNIAFSPNGKYLATASLDNTVRLLKITATTTGQADSVEVDCKLHADGVPNNAGAIGDGVVAVKFSPNGKYLATASFNSARLWTVNNEKDKISHTSDPLLHWAEPTNNMDYFLNPIVAIDFSQDSKYLATASSDGTISVWYVDSLKPKLKIKLPSDSKTYILSVTFSYDGNYITATGVNGIAYVWELKAGNSVSKPQLPLYSYNATDSTFSVNSEYLATASADGTVSVSKIPNFRNPIVSLPTNNYIINVSFSPNGKYIAAISLDKKVYIWDSTPRHQSISLGDYEIQDTNVAALDFSSDDKYLAIANTKPDSIVTVLDITKKVKCPPVRPKGNGLVIAVAFSPTLEPDDPVYLAMVTADSSIDIRTVRPYSQQKEGLVENGVTHKPVCNS